MNANPTYNEAIYHIALHCIGFKSEVLDKYLIQGAIVISIIFEASRPDTYEKVLVEYQRLNLMYTSSFTISVREEDVL